MGALSNGGISQLASIAMMPMQNPVTGMCGAYAFDPLFGFNDPVNPSVHSYKVEEVMHGRTPTVTRLLVTYRDLGIVQVVFTFSYTDDAGQVQSSSIPATLGNKQQTNKELTKMLFPNSAITGQNIQLTVNRAANAGALSIVKVTICGRVEKQEYA
jgi:hypothetical protein